MPICFRPQGDSDYEDKQDVIVDSIDYPIGANADSVDIFAFRQFEATVRTWTLFEGPESCARAFLNASWKVKELFA